MMSPNRRSYQKLAEFAITELLKRELAMATAEFEAKVSDRVAPGLDIIVEPLHVSQARIVLELTNKIRVESVQSRGAHPVQIATAVTDARNTTAVSRAVARKGLLMSRYLGWAQGTDSRPGSIGPATEKVVEASLLTVAQDGYRILGPGDTFLGVQVNGPLDNRAIYTPMVDDLPGKPIAVPVEVKGGREWLMAGDYQPYQLLDKAAQLQRARPETAIAPLFFCRKPHITLFRMARDLGFFVIPAGRQFISPATDERHLQEVRAELGFIDLVATDSADEQFVRRLTKAFPSQAEVTAERWARTAQVDEMAEIFEDMRDATDRGYRTAQFNLMRGVADAYGLYENQGW